MSKLAKQYIKSMADEFRKNLKSKRIATMYGEPVDFDDPDAVLVACVLLAREEALEECRSQHSLLLGLHK